MSIRPIQTKNLRVISAALLAVLGCSQALADWQLNADESSLHYVTNKNNAIAEINSFQKISGAISDNGEARLEIELASVDTRIPIRDERMREILFKVMQHPSAVATLEVDNAKLERMQVGAAETETYTIALELHGVQQNLPVLLEVRKITENSIQVQPAQPVIVNANSFNLGDGVEELREVAGLNNINHNVVVDFNFIFTDGM